ncbi:MAG: imidazole glycerol phosphate synthase subunit HisF [Caldicoprobacterales bacterium]|jgi:cyclase|nr:imidazole glycerol phosphate synthase subunit HisF [Clostridiales bacterium]
MNIRVIPCLDIKDGRVVKGVQFTDLKDAGDPVEIAKAYDKAGADELFLLNVMSSNESKSTFKEIIKKIVNEISIPLIAGGGVKNFQDVNDLLNIGASKVVISSAVFKNPQLISQVASKLGSQSIIVAIDAKKINSQENKWSVVVDSGKTNTHMDVIQWAMDVQKMGAGEILLTSIDKDGTKTGYDIPLLKAVTKQISIPVIASGGAGKLEHFYDAINEGSASALLAASLFHFKVMEIRQLKSYLLEKGIKVII